MEITNTAIPLLIAEDISYTYEGETTPALSHLSLSIQSGKKIACLGANGSGKSTFFLCCNGILRPDKGALLYKGQPISYQKKALLELRKKVGIVFQEPDRQLFSSNVFHEIAFGPCNMGWSHEAVKKKVQHIMEQFGMEHLWEKPTHALSGGEKKQVAIADILVMEPELFILDEPTSALDPKHTKLVRNMIQELENKHRTIMIATHDVDYALSWADEVIIFHQGKVLIQGNPVDVFSRKDILEKANLITPTPMKVYFSFIEKGLLCPTLPIPRTMEQLLAYM